MKISSLLEKETVLINLKAGNKTELISGLVEKLEPKIGTDMIESVKEAVLEREQVMSTGVGKSLAIPHAKIAGIEDNFAVFAKLENPIEYGSIDNQPVEIVFLLVGGQEKASIHIKLLSRISRLMNNDVFRNQLLHAKSPDEVIRIFSEEEN